jgi:hypothetical protein
LPCRSSWSPGISPSSIICDRRGPSPNTTCVALRYRSQPRHPGAESRNDFRFNDAGRYSLAPEYRDIALAPLHCVLQARIRTLQGQRMCQREWLMCADRVLQFESQIIAGQELAWAACSVEKGLLSTGRYSVRQTHMRFLRFLSDLTVAIGHTPGASDSAVLWLGHGARGRIRSRR